jgi:hypothetical protein
VLHGKDVLNADSPLRKSILNYLKTNFPYVDWTTDVNAQGRHIFMCVLTSPRLDPEIFDTPVYNEYLKTTDEPFIIAATTMRDFQIPSPYKSTMSQIIYHVLSREIIDADLDALTKVIERL